MTNWQHGQKRENHNNVRFSVVIPAYNRAKFLGAAIDSVLSQTFTDFEVIVVDDGSTDGTPDILKAYGDRIQAIRQENSGPEVARNAGVAAARGEYIALLDCDDFFFPTALETYDRVLRALDSPPLVVGSEVYYRDGKPLPVQPMPTDRVEVIVFKDCLSKTVPLNLMCSLYLIRKSVYEEIGGFRNTTSRTWHGDIVDFVLKIGTHGPLVIIQTPRTVVYRLHGENSVNSSRAHANGLLGVARLERQGAYPGGRKRLLDRYTFLGGVSAQWAAARCWRDGDRRMAIRLVLGTAPMVAIAVWRKFLRRFKKPPEVIVLPEGQSEVMSPLTASSRRGSAISERPANQLR